jgi:hypothetical protein
LLDLRLLAVGVALLGGRDEAGIDDLAGHRDVPGLAHRLVEAGEQAIDRPGLGQPLAKDPDRLGIGRLVGEAEPEEAHEREPVVDEELGAVVGQVVVRLDHQDLEHEDGIERRPAAFGTVGVVERRLELGPEHLEVDNPRERLQLITQIAKPRQAILDVEEPRLSTHRPVPQPSTAESESDSHRFFEAFSSARSGCGTP